MERSLTHLSLCSGIGGLDLAAEWAGFRTIGQCEIDDYASKVLAKNFKGVPNFHDIRTITAKRLAEYGINAGNITVVSAGIPCQPYSLAGKGLGDLDERDLEQEYMRVIGEVRPKWAIIENTPGLFARKNQRYFRRILDDFTALGYSVAWGMWGACDVGAPHKRQRIFIIAWNTDCKHDKKKQTIYQKNINTCRICRKISNTDSKRKLQSEKTEQNFGKRSLNSSWWEIEPDVGRMAYGVSARVDKLRGLGNAVVPYQAYPIFDVIAEIELIGD